MHAYASRTDKSEYMDVSRIRGALDRSRRRFFTLLPLAPGKHADIATATTRLTKQWAAHRNLPSLSEFQQTNSVTQSNSARRISVWQSAKNIGIQSGVYPISFSYLRQPTPCVHKVRWLSGIIPYKAYTFSDEQSYRHEYASSVFALTHKKGGWDCHRHLEIMFSNCIPIMPDVDAIPAGTMHFYPKHLLAATFGALARGNSLDLAVMAKAHRDWAEDLLTPKSMVAYVDFICNLSASGPLLFVDFDLHDTPDYLSMQLLSGIVLNRLPVQVVRLPRYLWETSSAASRLYGRGFGYAGALTGEPVPEEHADVEAQPGVGSALSDLCDSRGIGAILFAAAHKQKTIINEWIAINRERSHPIRTVVADGGDDPVYPRKAENRHEWMYRFARELSLRDDD